MLFTTGVLGRSVDLDVDTDDETQTHSFVVRIWLEEVSASGRALWRGHITHVPSGRRRYVQRLGDITGFIALYLELMGVQLGMRWSIRRWLRQRAGLTRRADG